MDLYHDKVTLIDSEQNLTWEEHQQEIKRFGEREKPNTKKRRRSVKLLSGMKAKTVLDKKKKGGARERG